MASASDIDTLWDYQDPVGSEARFREALQRLESETASSPRSSVENSHSRAEVRTQIARAICLQRRFDDAHAELDEAQKCLDEGLASGVDGEPVNAGRAHVRVVLERSRI